MDLMKEIFLPEFDVELFRDSVESLNSLTESIDKARGSGSRLLYGVSHCNGNGEFGTGYGYRYSRPRPKLSPVSFSYEARVPYDLGRLGLIESKFDLLRVTLYTPAETKQEANIFSVVVDRDKSPMFEFVTVQAANTVADATNDGLGISTIEQMQRFYGDLSYADGMDRFFTVIHDAVRSTFLPPKAKS